MISLVHITVSHDKEVLMIPSILLVGDTEEDILETAKNYITLILIEMRIDKAQLAFELHEFPCKCKSN